MYPQSRDAAPTVASKSTIHRITYNHAYHINSYNHTTSYNIIRHHTTSYDVIQNHTKSVSSLQVNSWIVNGCTKAIKTKNYHRAVSNIFKQPNFCWVSCACQHRDSPMLDLHNPSAVKFLCIAVLRIRVCKQGVEAEAQKRLPGATVLPPVADYWCSNQE